MRTVNQLLDIKGSEVWSITPSATTYDALQVTAEKKIGALLVMDGDSIMGIFSERDYARKVVLKGKSSKDTPVGDIMSKKVLYVSPEQTIEECMAIMTESHVRHLPVCTGEKVVGLISIGDVVKSIISHQQFMIDQLQKYITGSR